MGLPVIEVPTYETILPSSGKKVKFRPFLVKEQKILLIALDAGDKEDINRSITEIVDSCTFSELNTKSLASFDIEYLFMNIRAKSVGEEIELSVKCSTCSEPNDYSMKIDDLTVTRNKDHSSKIQLTSSIGITMRYPTLDELSRLRSNYSIDMISTVIAECIEMIYDDEEVYKSQDSTVQERVEWIEKLNQEQYDKIEKFFETAPFLSTKIEFNCRKCNTLNSIDVEGIADFFG